MGVGLPRRRRTVARDRPALFNANISAGYRTRLFSCRRNAIERTDNLESLRSVRQHLLNREVPSICENIEKALDPSLEPEKD